MPIISTGLLDETGSISERPSRKPIEVRKRPICTCNALSEILDKTISRSKGLLDRPIQCSIGLRDLKDKILEGASRPLNEAQDVIFDQVVKLLDNYNRALLIIFTNNFEKS